MSDFDSMVTGLPADDDAATALLRSDLQDQGSAIANTSPYSPFFVLLAAIFNAPLLYLRDLITGTILPGLFAQQATGTLLDLRAADMDDARKAATKAVGNLTFYRAGTTGDLVIAAGTVVESPPIDGVTYQMATLADGTIPDGSSSAQIAAEAADVGAAYNLGDGYYCVLPTPVPGVTAVANESGWLTSPGTDTESDTDLRARLLLKWGRLSGWHTEDTYKSLISDVAGIEPGDVYFDLSAPRGAGSADAYILTSAGIPSQALVDTANSYINDDGYHGLGDDLQVKAMPALDVPIDVAIIAADTASAADKTQLANDAEDLIKAAFRQSAAYASVPRVAPFARLALSELAAQLHDNLSLVASVSFTAPAADVVPAMELPVIPAATLDAGAVVDEGGGLVGLPATAHGLTAGTRITVSGTVNYDGVYTVDASSTADVIVVTAAYAAEVLTGAETATALVVTVT